MSVGEMSVGEMSVGEVSVGEMSVGEMSWIRLTNVWQVREILIHVCIMYMELITNTCRGT